MFKKSLFLLVLFVFVSSKAQNPDNNTEYLEYDKDVIIGSFSSSVVFLMHIQLDLLKNSAFDFQEQKKYYKSQLQILSIINDSFRKNMNDFVLKAMPGEKDRKLLKKLMDFSDIYRKQIELLEKYIESQDNEVLKEFSELHEEMKTNISNLFNERKGE